MSQPQVIPETLAGWWEWVGGDLDPTPFDGVEVGGVQNTSEDPSEKWLERCDDKDAELWSVYLHYKPDPVSGIGGVDCIADFELKSDAEAYAEQWRQYLNEHAPARG